MKAPPKILALTAIAVGGVLAFKTLDAAGGLPGFLSDAVARAEAPATKGKPGEAQSHAPGDAKPGAPANAAKPPAPVCAPSAADLAREAGLSPAELQVIQSLSARRGQLDAREQALDVQIQLMAAAEAKVDAKLKALDVSKAQIQALLGQADAQSQAEVDRLVVVYEKMKPRDAGALMAQLDERVRTPVAAKIKPAILAQILPNMGIAEAKKLTETLARRFAAAREAVETAMSAQAAANAKPGVAAPGAQTQTAAASPPPADKAAAATKPPAPKPQRIAKATPPKPRPRPVAKPDAAPPAATKPDAPAADPAKAVAKAEPKPAEAKPTEAKTAPATAKPAP